MKKYFYFLFISFLVFLLSCNEDALTSDITSNIEPSAIEHFCLDAYLPEKILIQKDSADEISINGVIQKSKKWNAGQVITIKFLNGNSFLQGKVKQFANEWLKYANLKFQYVASNQNADIKINFDNSGGSWSYVGTDCKYIGQNNPSMNFGWFTNSTPDKEFSRTIIHEFGHALGLHHEHQSPAANIQWNKPKVYAYYGGAPNYWSATQVDNAIFLKYSSTVTNYTAFDNQSIMLYSFPASLTLNGWYSNSNTVLSATDKIFITQQYPGKTNSETKNLYRYNINAQHFYTSNYAELGNRFYESILGKVYSTQVTNTYPIYRYFNSINGDRLSTLNWNELKNGGQGGWRYEGITGYAYNTQQPNTIPVYRYFNHKVTKPDHFYTISNTEVAGEKYGYKYEGIAFYVLK